MKSFYFILSVYLVKDAQTKKDYALKILRND